MDKKWCLLKDSDGNRGIDGKKKVYEVIVLGTTVHMSWGMAEKTSRQTTTIECANPNIAAQIAHTKVYSKMASGYKLAYTV